MRIAIVDDSAADIELLDGYLDQYLRLHDLHAEIMSFPEGRSLLAEYERGRFDLLFLDICMDELDGISLAERIRAVDRNCLIVFTTTSTEYAVDSYRVRAFHYLLKPLTPERLFGAMDLCAQALAKHSLSIQIKCRRELVRVPLSDIIHTDYSNHYIYLYTKPLKGGSLRTSLSFGAFTDLLQAYPRFLNCYRNTIINMDEVDRMEQDSFLMSSGVTVPMWRNRKAELRRRYAEYMFDKLNGR